MTTTAMLIWALLLDAVTGEPRWLWSRVPHPAVLMGRLIGWCDKTLNTNGQKQLKGALTLALLVILTGTLGAVLSLAGPLVSIILAAILIAQKSLIEHVTAVADGLRYSTNAGRAQVAMIVSRDTAEMDDSAVARAAIESAAENFSDGILAPAFWFLIAGLPGILIYKAVNTADSMIGYRNDRYEDFGKAAARVDDLLNWIPARLTAVLFALIGNQLKMWPDIVTDARKHRSPNAGWPEAALARGLDIAVSGPRVYDGILREFAWVNGSGRKALSPEDIDAAVRMVWKSWATFILALGLILLIF